MASLISLTIRCNWLEWLFENFQTYLITGIHLNPECDPWQDDNQDARKIKLQDH